VPQSGNIGLGISIFSYNGKVTLGIMVDEQLVREPQRVIDGYERELADLEARFLAKSTAGANGKPASDLLLPAPEPATFEG
jgi:hypothetical protein